MKHKRKKNVSVSYLISNLSKKPDIKHIYILPKYIIELALDTIQLVFQLKEEMKFYYNYPLVDPCLTKRITNQQIA